tara:strand:- start:6173 stop:6550 length:378 start_codon:yes stop_codon:yes gene_type:complete
MKQLIKFLCSGSIATLVDYGLFLIVFIHFFPPVISHILSFSCGWVVNFSIQRKYVFKSKKKINATIRLGILFSSLGLLFSSGILYGLNLFPFFLNRQYLSKLIVTGILTIYNFFTTRYIFTYVKK